jgi:ATP-binding cassette subfamily B protein IrtA
MKQKKENSMALLLHWAGEQKFWLFLAILLSMCSGLCIIVPYIGIYRLMDATFNNACTKELVVQTVAMIAAAVTLRFVLFGCSGVAAQARMVHCSKCAVWWRNTWPERLWVP